MGITIVCYEHDKYRNRKPVTYIVKREANASDVTYFGLRGIYNPELEYYATKVEGDDDFILALAKTKGFKEPFFVRI